MQKYNLREMLCLADADPNRYTEVDGPYWKLLTPAHVQSMKITPSIEMQGIAIALNSGFSVSDAAQGILQGIKDGDFDSYQNLTLLLNPKGETFESRRYGGSVLPFDGVYQSGNALTRLDDIGEAIVKYPIGRIRLYENYRDVVIQHRGNWTVDIFFGLENQNGQIWVTPMTTSGHLSPFVNGEVTPNGILKVYDNNGAPVLEMLISAAGLKSQS